MPSRLDVIAASHLEAELLSNIGSWRLANFVSLEQASVDPDSRRDRSQIRAKSFQVVLTIRLNINPNLGSVGPLAKWTCFNDVWMTGNFDAHSKTLLRFGIRLTAMTNAL